MMCASNKCPWYLVAGSTHCLGRRQGQAKVIRRRSLAPCRLLLESCMWGAACSTRREENWRRRIQTESCGERGGGRGGGRERERERGGGGGEGGGGGGEEGGREREREWLHACLLHICKPAKRVALQKLTSTFWVYDNQTIHLLSRASAYIRTECTPYLWVAQWNVLTQQ